MLTSLAFALTLGLRTPAIDFDHAPAPATVIVEALAKQLGRNLVADENLAVDILIVHLDQADPDEALKWIAEAIDGEWVEKDGVRRLTRSNATEQKQEADERSEILRTIKENLAGLALGEPLDRPTAELVTELIAPYVTQQSPNSQLPLDLSARLPANRLAMRVARAIDYRQFLDLPQGAEVYVPFDAASVDRRLPREILSYLSDYRKEDAIFAAATKRLGLIYPEFVRFGCMQPGDWSDGPVKGAVRISNHGYVEADIVIAWGNNSPVTFSPLYLRETRPDPLVKHKEWEFVPKLDERSLHYWSLTRPRDFVPQELAVKVPEDVRNYFLKDNEFDLFGLGASGLVAQAARALDKSIVACLPDSSSYAPLRLTVRPTLTLQEISYYLFLTSEVIVTERRDVLLAIPRFPATTRRGRLPRTTVRRIFVDAERGFSDIDVYADMVAKSDGKTFVADPRQTFARGTRIVHLPESFGEASLALRAYAQLTEIQRKAAKSRPEVIPWQSLKEFEKTFWSTVIASRAMIGYPGAIESEISVAELGKEDPLKVLREVTKLQVVPSGLVVRVEDGTALAGADSTDQFPYYSLIEGLTFESMMADKELDRGGWGIDKFVLLPRTRIIVSLLVAGEILELARFEDAYGKETLPIFGIKGIPGDLIKAHRTEIDRIKEELRNIPPR